MDRNVLFVEKYRPRLVEDTILPDDIKAKFQSYVDNKLVPNLLLTGKAGVGKTTVAKAMLDQIGAEYIVINGSLDGNIDTLRNNVKQFASSMSFKKTRKYVILDEADYLTNATQPALRQFMEEYSKTCGFILTCNYPQRIIKELHSRCSVIDFKITKSEHFKALVPLFLKRLIFILKSEKIEYDINVLPRVVAKFFPDWRRILNEIQGYAAIANKVDSGILSLFVDANTEKLIGFIKDKDFTESRKWVAENPDIEPVELFRSLYDTLSPKLTVDTVPELTIILAEYQYMSAFVADQQINTSACIAKIMAECSFKD